MMQRLVSLRSTSPLVDLFDLGLSFRLMLSWGRLPPLETMNEFLACGRDDTSDTDEGLLQWDPCSISAAEYDELGRELARRGHEVCIDTVSPRRAAPSYEKWFAAHLAKRPAKPRSGRKRPRE